MQALAEEVPAVRLMFNNNRGADAPAAARALPGADRPGPSGLSDLDAIAADIRAHGGCGFEPCETATNPVPGEGNPQAEVVLVGEAPGASEDAEGRPFVGRAGKLLDELLAEAGLARDRSSSPTSSSTGPRATATRAKPRSPMSCPGSRPSCRPSDRAWS